MILWSIWKSAAAWGCGRLQCCRFAVGAGSAESSRFFPPSPAPSANNTSLVFSKLRRWRSGHALRNRRAHAPRSPGRRSKDPRGSDSRSRDSRSRRLRRRGFRFGNKRSHRTCYRQRVIPRKWLSLLRALDRGHSSWVSSWAWSRSCSLPWQSGWAGGARDWQMAKHPWFRLLPVLQEPAPKLSTLPLGVLPTMMGYGRRIRVANRSLPPRCLHPTKILQPLFQ